MLKGQCVVCTEGLVTKPSMVCFHFHTPRGRGGPRLHEEAWAGPGDAGRALSGQTWGDGIIWKWNSPPPRPPAVFTAAGMEEKVGGTAQEREWEGRWGPACVLTTVALMLALTSGDKQEESPEPSGLRTDSDDDRDEPLASGPQNPLHPTLLPHEEPSKMNWLQGVSSCPGPRVLAHTLTQGSRQHGWQM